MGKSNPLYRVFFIMFLAAGVLGGSSACKQYKCPANGGSYVDAPKKVNKYRKSKPQSGLWDKKMSRKKR